MCGNTIQNIPGGRLQSGGIKSCGCLRGKCLIKHGESVKNKRTAEYVVFIGAKNRCQNPNNPNFHNYGGRGIEFRFSSFDEFFEELGRRPSPDHSVDRIDVNGHYEKGNVRWATRKEQNRNRTDNHWITIGDKTLTIVQWSEITEISSVTICARIKYGWCEPCAVTLPRYHKCPHRPQAGPTKEEIELVEKEAAADFEAWCYLNEVV